MSGSNTNLQQGGRSMQHWTAIFGIVISVLTTLGGLSLFVVSHSVSVGQSLEANHAAIENLKTQEVDLSQNISENKSRIANLEHSTSETATDLAVLKSKMSNIETQIGEVNTGIQHLQDMLATRHPR